MERKAKEEKEISQAREAMIGDSEVVPAVMELGIILIQQAQAQTNPQARKSLLDEAEATFLAIGRIAGGREDFQLSLAQVYYWQGRQREGRELFENVLKDRKRDPESLLEVSRLFRSVGSNSEARKLAEEGFGKAVPGRVKSGCAVMVGFLSDETAERIEWFKKADTNDPQVKAILSQERANQGRAGERATGCQLSEGYDLDLRVDAGIVRHAQQRLDRHEPAGHPHRRHGRS